MRHCIETARTMLGRKHGIRSAVTAASCLLLLLCAAPGCMSSKISSPERTGVEQLLLGTAADRALSQIDFSAFRDCAVFVDAQYLDSYRAEYVTAALRDKLGTDGAFLVEERIDAEVILEPRASALSIDESSTLIGLPAMSVPVPLSGGLAIPELSLLKSHKQKSIGKVAVTAYSVRHRGSVVSLGPAVGQAYYNRWWALLLISFRTTDLPEK